LADILAVAQVVPLTGKMIYIAHSAVHTVCQAWEAWAAAAMVEKV
jgi:hypothetical protein